MPNGLSLHPFCFTPPKAKALQLSLHLLPQLVIISIVFSSTLLLSDIPKLFYISSYTISFLSFNFHIVYMYLILSLRESWFNFFCIWLYWDLSYGGLVLVWKEKLWTYLQGLDTQMFNILYLLTYRVECVHDL
jgi:hypothetical protein